MCGPGNAVIAAQLTVNLLESYLSWTMVKRRSNILVHQTRREENEGEERTRGRIEKSTPHEKEDRGESCTTQEGREVFEHLMST